jgi:hypothetical protein
MNALRILLCTVVLGLIAASVGAQDDVPAPDTAPEATPPNEPPNEPRGAEAADDDVFIPSEELQAEEEVTFPVDI